VVVPLVAGGAALVLIGVLFLSRAGSDDSASGSAKARTVTAERRSFTATVPLAGTVDVNPAPADVPVSYMVTARVDPLVLYRLPESLSKATVKIAGGPPEFGCAVVVLATIPARASSTGQSSDSSGDTSSTDTGSGDSSVSPFPAEREVQAAAETVVRCLVPPDVRVFPGLRAELVVTTAQLPEAIVVPAGAVEPESAQTGFVTVIGRDDAEERRPVKVGPSDGSFVVITSGVAEGERVLDRVPIQTTPSGAEGGGRVVVR